MVVAGLWKCTNLHMTMGFQRILARTTWLRTLNQLTARTYRCARSASGRPMMNPRAGLSKITETGRWATMAPSQVLRK